MSPYDKDGENRAAAAAAAVARRKWREAQAGVVSAGGPLVWVSTRIRLPEHRSVVLACFEPSIGYHPSVQVLVFFKASALDPQTMKDLDGGPDEGRKFTADDFVSVDGAFWDMDAHLYVPTDDDFPAYWMPLPRTPWEGGAPQ